MPITAVTTPALTWLMPCTCLAGCPLILAQQTRTLVLAMLLAIVPAQFLKMLRLEMRQTLHVLLPLVALIIAYQTYNKMTKMRLFHSSRYSSPHSKNGFTMIELLVVTTIIIVLTTVGLVSYRSASQNARNGKRKADLESVRQALVLYRVDNGTYPSGSNFNAMVTTISDYLASIEVTDPTGGSYVYSYTSDGATFSITALLEPDAQVYTVVNP